MDMITPCSTRPDGAPCPAGEPNMHVGNIKLTRPAQE
jgi:hypothetical protein